MPELARAAGARSDCVDDEVITTHSWVLISMVQQAMSMFRQSVCRYA